MKKFLFSFLTVIAIFAITSCELDNGKDNNPTTSSRNFWAQNVVTQAFYQLTAEKLAENSRCEVWAEKGSGVTAETAKNIADEYSNNIYTKMIANFGWEDNIPLTNGKSIKMNTMEFAHALATGSLTNAKLTILLLDIKDGYKPGVNESYVAGYFWPYDLYSAKVPAKYKTNVLDMIYIDINPGFKNKAGIKEAYTTLAHEMQHLMNFTSSVLYRKSIMDTWIDEGLSSAAEWIYSGEHITDRIEWFNENGDGDKIKGKIDVGNNFYVWDNRVSDSDPYPVLDDYATVYLFFQWIRLQSNSDIYKEIIKSSDDDYNAVINAFNAKKSSGASYSSWEAMLKDWLKANNTNSTSGRDGYMNDTTLKTVKAPYAPTETTTINLYPGEGVYSYSASTPSFSPSGNIKYEYLTAKSTLLTYNSNSVNYAQNINTLIESGTTTGVKPLISGRFDMKMSSSKISGPFPIGIGDVLRVNNTNKTFNFDSLSIERAFIDE